MDALEAEQRYIAGTMGLKQLAAETGTPIRTLERWCKAGKWVDKRRRIRKKAAEKAEKQAVNRTARELSEMKEACLSMGRVILRAAKRMEEMERPEDSGKYWRKDVLTMAESVERLAHALNMMGTGMSQKDAEALKLQKRRQDMEEAKERQENAGAQIALLPEVAQMMDADMEELTHADAGNAGAEQAAEAILRE